MKIKIYILIIAGLILSACGDAAVTTIDDAWTLFESKQYQEALDTFNDLAVDDSTAYIGAGWSLLRLYSYPGAQTAFDKAPESPDAHAGNALTYWALVNPTQAIVQADFALASSSNYVFSHDTRINSKDLNLVRAYSYYELGRYARSLDAIKAIESTYNPTFQPGDSAAVLLAKLSQLGPVNQ